MGSSKALIIAVMMAILTMVLMGCDDGRTAASGVTKADVEVPVSVDGMTVEQENIRNRLVEDNKPGAIKHLYVISAYSGQTILYSTVKGKVTSGGKRLSPGRTAQSSRGDRFVLEALGDDGAYGSSIEYLYWWDTRGVYHQHYVSGGQIVHLSNEPVAVKSVIINLSGETDEAME